MDENKEIVVKKIDKDPEVVALESVYETWKNFFAGKYNGQGFVFWILGAAFLDVLGFIFFLAAFKKQD